MPLGVGQYECVAPYPRLTQAKALRDTIAPDPELRRASADSSLRSSGATSLMVWHLIRFTAERSAIFDFDGSVLQPVERFFRGFGAKQVPYHWIMKFPFWLRAYLRAKHDI